LSISKSLDPAQDSFADDGHGQIVFDNEAKPTEGPEVIKLVGQDTWYIYGDPFNSPLQAWETTDFKTYTKIQVTTPQGAKHCSMFPISKTELNRLLTRYPNTVEAPADPTLNDDTQNSTLYDWVRSYVLVRKDVK
ncbi:MAG: hypothetical protein HQ515_24555, partial [Phycisphaeraceae bacterium]|nr:hypothetical protein [Phycisphaeraceae bacterium]